MSYRNTKQLIEKETSHGILDLGNQGRTGRPESLNNGKEFDCSGPELAVHFALSGASMEGSVIVDQVDEKVDWIPFVQRAGWFLKYEQDV